MTRYLKVLSTTLIFIISLAIASDWSDTILGPSINNSPIILEESEFILSLAQTNDIHGNIKGRPNSHEGNRMAGGLDWLGGYLKIIRQDRGKAFLLLDGGDTFQGTLESNYFEGKPLVELMKILKYDAVVSGNHGFDYGPVGPESSYDPTQAEYQSPTGALEKLVELAAQGENSYPFLASNVYLKESVVYHNGEIVDFDEVEKAIKEGSLTRAEFDVQVNWQASRRPDFLTPYIIKTVTDPIGDQPGIRVAIIGIEGESTPRTTDPINVAHLFFRDEIKAYQDAYEEVKDKADIFVAVSHIGSRTGSPLEPQDGSLTSFARGIDPDQLHAAIGGHTHWFNEQITNSIPIIQSWSGANYFGEIRLVINKNTRQVIREKTRLNAAIPIFHYACLETSPGPNDDPATFKPGCIDDTSKPATFRGREVVPQAAATEIINYYKDQIEPILSAKLANSDIKMSRSRNGEANLGNFMAEGLRSYFSSDVAMINSGGIRADINPGIIEYRHLFAVMPFDNKAILVENVPLEKFIDLVNHHIQSCGEWGGLQISGFRMQYERDCTERDPKGGALYSKLINLQLTDTGQFLVQNGEIVANHTVNIGTIDFMYKGGSGYTALMGMPLGSSGVLFRDVLELYMKQNGPDHVWHVEKDGRMENVFVEIEENIIEQNSQK